MAVDIKVGETKTKSATSWCAGGYQSTFYVSVKLNSQDINANTSNITVTFYLVNGSRWDGGHSPGTITVGTTQRASGEVNNTYGGGSWPVGRRYDICSWTGNINHNNNGTLSIPIKGYWDGNTSYAIWIPDDVTITETYNLPTIPREHLVTVSPKLVESTSTPLNITVNNRGNSFTHTVQWRVTKGTTGWVTLATRVTTTTFSVPYNTIKARVGSYTSSDIEVQVTTYNGTTQIGSVQTAKTQFLSLSKLPLSLYDNLQGSVGASIGTEANKEGFNVYLPTQWMLPGTIALGGVLNDYVIEQGITPITVGTTTEHWVWRKWASGVSECWGKFYVKIPASSWSAWGNVYSAYVTGSGIPYPSGLFVSTTTPNLSEPHFECTITCEWGAMTETEGFGSNTSTPAMCIIRGTNPGTALGVVANMRATGRWK